MAGQVFFNNGINISSGGNVLLNGLITDIVNELNAQDTSYKQDKVEMAFTDTRALNIDQTFTGVA